MKAKTTFGTVVALLGLALTGCSSGVSKADYDALNAQLQAKTDEVAKLQKEAPAPAPPFGIVSETFDASGPPAYQAQPGQWLAFVQSGMSYDSPAGSNYVTVVDVKSRKVLAQAAVPMPKGYASHGLGVSADARWIYMPSLTAVSKKLHILDGRTLKLAMTLDVGANTHHVDEGTYKQTGKFIMVDTYNPEHGEIILDPNNNNKVVGQIPFSTVFGRPYSGWSSPDGSFAYVTVNSHLADQKGWISKIDLSTYKEIGFLPLGVGPVWVAFASDGKTAWVSHAKSNDVMEIKIGQTKDEVDKVIADVPLGSSIYGIVLANDGQKLYAVNKTYGAKDASTTIYVVDTEAKKVVKEIDVGKQPDHVFLSPDGKEVWVGENRGNEVSIIDTTTDEVAGTIPMPG
ncbi:MAG: YncE family protein, partial [Chloroflexota bacterium]|nr:YncE family protein [Chloroflexota bacterium]